MEFIEIGNFKNSSTPVRLPIGYGISLLYDTNTKGNVHDTLRDAVIQLVKNHGVKNVQLTIIDIGVRFSFPGLQNLHQVNEKITIIRDSNRALDMLQNLTEHAREIDEILGNDFNTLEEYNGQADRKEPVQIILIANFPVGLETKFQQFEALLKEAERTGLFFLFSMDASYFSKSDDKTKPLLINLQKGMVNGFPTSKGYSFINIHPTVQKTVNNLGFDWKAEEAKKISKIIQKINDELALVTNPENKEDFLKIEIGRKGRKPFFLEMGDKSGIVHGLIAGATGTGKSSLLNIIIVKIAEQYSPEELQLYLLDYKEGVEFFIYENHPNVKVLLLDNQNRDFAKEKLQEFNQEIKKRSDAFIELSEQTGEIISDITRYNQVGATKMPRLILLIDEFKQLFEKTSFSYQDSLDQLITKVAQQGRGFGLHLLFGSQSFNSVKWSASTKEQFELRIAFKVADTNASASIMDYRNTSPTLLNKDKHEIIYNTDYGNNKNPQKNHKVQTELFFTKSEIPSLLQKANEKYKGITLEKEICRSDSNSDKKSETQTTLSDEKSKLVDDLDQRFEKFFSEAQNKGNG